MKVWVDLYSQHRSARSLKKDELNKEVRVRIQKLVRAELCDPTAPSLYTYDHNNRDVYWYIGGSTRGVLPLKNIPDLVTAELTVMATESRKHHLHQLTVMVEGRRHDGSTWALAVHLPDDRGSVNPGGGDQQGLGACSHAALHCHVGPDLSVAPKVRVPMPALRPSEVLDWVLSQIIPKVEFEPAEWANVRAALQQSGP